MAPSDKSGEELWSWVEQLPDGSVGQVAVMIPFFGNALCNLTYRSRDIAVKMQPYAQLYAKRSGNRVWLRQFRMVADHEDA
jgi:hypothetical protein